LQRESLSAMKHPATGCSRLIQAALAPNSGLCAFDPLRKAPASVIGKVAEHEINGFFHLRSPGHTAGLKLLD